MLKRTGIAVLVATACALPVAAQNKQFITPSDPTIINFTVIQPHNLAEHINGVGQIAVRGDLSFPPDPTASLEFPPINGLHRLDNPGQFIFAIADGYLTAELGRPATGIDVIRTDGAGNYRFFFCGGAVVPALNVPFPIDALYLDRANGDLVMSFSSSGANLGGALFLQADLVRYQRTGPGCEDWAIVGREFNSVARVPDGVDLVGATVVDTGIVMSFDIPTDLSGTTTALPVRPMNLVLWDGTEFVPYAELTAWQDAPPLSSVSLPPDTCTALGDPGPDEDPLLTCGASWLTDLLQPRDRIDWRPLDGAASYNVYTALLSALDPLSPECQSQQMTDTQFTMDDVPPAGDGFYILISAVSAAGVEGSLGQDSNDVSRPNPTPCSVAPPGETDVATR